MQFFPCNLKFHDEISISFENLQQFLFEKTLHFLMNFCSNKASSYYTLLHTRRAKSLQNFTQNIFSPKHFYSHSTRKNQIVCRTDPKPRTREGTLFLLPPRCFFYYFITQQIVHTFAEKTPRTKTIPTNAHAIFATNQSTSLDSSRISRKITIANCNITFPETSLRVNNSGKIQTANP